MNDKEIKSVIRKFRTADLSVIKDEKLRSQALKLQAKQGGFTLLELLVVITLIAVLATGALVAYEGIGESAQAAAASNNTATADSAIRNFRAVTQNYPDQWDSLVTAAGAAPGFLHANTQAAFSNLPLAVSAGAGDFRDTLDQALTSVGINALQLPPAVAVAGVEPNLQHNEGATGGAAVETLVPAVTNFAVLPTWGAAAGCDINGTGAAVITQTMDGTAIGAAAGNRQNVINDSLENGECNLVIAVGFGHDAAHSTSNSSVAISSAPTFSNRNINPARDYARYVALFHVGQDGDGDNNIAQAELFGRPRLLAVLDTEGRMIDENIADQNPVN